MVLLAGCLPVEGTIAVYSADRLECRTGGKRENKNSGLAMDTPAFILVVRASGSQFGGSLPIAGLPFPLPDGKSKRVLALEQTRAFEEMGLRLPGRWRLGALAGGQRSFEFSPCLGLLQ